LREIADNIQEMRLDIREGSLHIPWSKQPIQNVRAGIVLTPDSLVLDEASFAYGKERFGLEGEIKSKQGEGSWLNLTHPRASLGSRFVYEPGSIRSGLWDITSDNSSFQLKGEITDINKLEVRLTGTGNVDFGEFEDFLRKAHPSAAQLKIPEPAEMDLEAEGPLTSMRNLKTRFRLRLPELAFSDATQLEDIEADLSWDSNTLECTYAKANIFGGEARLTGSASAKPFKKPALDLSVFIQNMDLGRAAPVLGIPGEKLSGTVNLDLKLNGLWGRADFLQGSGHFQVLNGHLWETPLYAELHKLSFVTIDGMERLTFKRADGSFIISDGKLITEDMILRSRLINLHLRGTVGFNGALDLLAISRFSSGLLQETDALGGLAPTVIAAAEEQIPHHHISGTLAKPVRTKLN